MVDSNDEVDGVGFVVDRRANGFAFVVHVAFVPH